MERGDDGAAKSHRERIRARLAAASLRRVHEEYRGRAAVLMPLVERDSRLHLLLTRRSLNVPTHKGQISFPGGLHRVRDGSLERTALRETREELGIHPSQVELLGPFHEYLAITERCVTPFVAFLVDPFEVSPDPCEVDAVLEVPLEFFLRTRPDCRIRLRLGRPVPVYSYDFNGHVIWGLTAAIIRDFVELLGERP